MPSPSHKQTIQRQNLEDVYRQIQNLVISLDDTDALAILKDKSRPFKESMMEVACALNYDDTADAIRNAKYGLASVLEFADDYFQHNHTASRQILEQIKQTALRLGVVRS